MSKTSDNLSIDNLLTMSVSELRNVMHQGHPINIPDLHNKMYKGYSLGLPKLMLNILWYTFRKTFYFDDQLGFMRGWNVRMEQNGSYKGDSRKPKQRKGKDWSFGHYQIHQAKDLNAKHIYGGWNQGLLLEYHHMGSSILDGSLGYCPLVSVNKGSSNLLLGWEVFKIGPFLLPLNSVWALEYEGELDKLEPVLI